MKLQILVPQYDETDNDIKNLLDSIEIQQNVDLKNDVGVIITNDGSLLSYSQNSDIVGKFVYIINGISV